ncbi:MAG TPA: hypothetical protein PLK12_07810 [Prolixibacteraceae bacterium]|nr:hypothetical protein [Prolixibacteraceae bacterium]
MKSKDLFFFLSIGICAAFILSGSKVVFGQDSPWFTEKEKMMGNRFFLELEGGGMVPYMHYPERTDFQIDENMLFLPGGGLILRMQRGKWFSWLPGIHYLQQGTHIVSPDEYIAKLHFARISLPVEAAVPFVSKRHKTNSAFLIFGGPYAAFPFPGKVHSGEWELPVFENSLTSFNWGFEAGIGFRIETFSLTSKNNLNLRFSWMQGLSDSFSPEEKALTNDAHFDRFPFLKGKRVLSGLKATLSIEIPFREHRVISFTAGSDGKKNYKKIVIIDEK